MSQDIIKAIIKADNSRYQDLEAIEALESEDNDLITSYFTSSNNSKL